MRANSLAAGPWSLVKHGALVWMAYGAVECAFTSVAPWILPPYRLEPPFHWGVALLLVVIYALFGAVLGAVAAVALRLAAVARSAAAERWAQAVLSATVLLAFAGNLAANVPPGQVVVGLVLLALLYFGYLLWRAPRPPAAVDFLAGPWTMSFVMVGLAWLIIEQLRSSPILAKLGGGLAWVAVLLAIAFFAGRLRIPARLITSLALVALAAATYSFNALPRPQPPSLPPGPAETAAIPLILISMDTVRADHLSLHGYGRPTTPNLERLAQEATVFTRAISTSDMTLSSHASMFTGLYSRSHGAHYAPPDEPYGRPLEDQFLTLAEILRERGYATLGIVANHGYLDHAHGLAQGFAYWDARRELPLLQPAPSCFLRRLLHEILVPLAPAVAADVEFRRAGAINREVEEVMQPVIESGKPFFLFVNYMDAHYPYLPPAPFDRFSSASRQPLRRREFGRLMRQVLSMEREISPDERQALVAAYDGEIAYIDAQIGALMDVLKNRGVYDRALIIVTSDHGEAFGEQHLITHAVSAYENQLRVPLLIKLPGGDEARTIDELVSHVDLLPTIGEILDFPVGLVHGTSLINLVGDRAGEREPTAADTSRRPVLGESYPHGVYGDWHPRFKRIQRAVYHGPMKLVRADDGSPEIYDLTADPLEENDLLGANPEGDAELEAHLDLWLSSVPAMVPGSDSSVDPATLERLRSLGYVN